MKIYLSGLMLGVILLFAPASHAWNDAGHMLLSSHAFELLSPKLRLKYINILKQHPRFQEDFVALKPAIFKNRNLDEGDAWIFALASTWPDLARHFGHVKGAKERDRLVEKYHRGRWHYVNHPLYLSSKDALSLSIPAPVLGIKPPPVLLQMNIVQALAFVELKIRNRHLTVADKAIYLCWWLHLMGDLHQPLHNVAMFAKKRFSTGDRGGNSIRVGKKSNLHRVWDGSLARHIEDWPTLSANSSVERPVRLHDRDGVSNYAGWSGECAELASEKVYTENIRDILRKTSRLPQPNEKQDRERTAIAVQQAQIASLRMHLLLKEF